MNVLHEEIRQTMLALNQENAHPVVEELRCHLANLFDMVRDELKRRLNERPWSEPSIGIAKQLEAPYKSVKIDGHITDEAKPLTAEELKSGGWWCGDISANSEKAFKHHGFGVIRSGWGGDQSHTGDCCILSNRAENVIARVWFKSGIDDLKQIHRIGNEFYWSEK